MTRNVSRAELLEENAWRRCKGGSPQDVDGFLHFAGLFAKIRHPALGEVVFPIRDVQEDIIRVWMSESRSIVLKARQVGFSTLVALYSLWLAMFWPDQLIIFLSRGQNEARHLLGMSTYCYERLPEWMVRRGPKRLTRSSDKLAFGNGSHIESLPSKKNAGRGRTVSLVVVDEWAFFENPEEAWSSIEPIADIGGRIIGLSTANGSGNFFHEFWQRAVSGRSTFKPMFFPWSAVPERDDAWFQAQCDNLPVWQRAQEYPSDPDEAFAKSGRPVFDVDALQALVCEQPRRGALVAADGFSGAGAEFAQTDGGWLRVWEEPVAGTVYVVGADVAAGLGHGDFSSAHVINTMSGFVAAKWHGHATPDIFASELAKLGHWYNRALVAVESNSYGLNTNRDLQKAKYPRIFFRRALDQRGVHDDVQNTVGWWTSHTTKPLMIGDLEAGLRTGTLRLRDAETVKELMTYVRDEKGATNGSPFDDQVISLAIAWQMVTYAANPEYALAQFEAPRGSFDYWVRKAKAVSNPERTVMGSYSVRP